MALVGASAHIHCASAASLTLMSDASAQTPLVITPLDSTDRLLVKVVNNTATDPPSEFLTGWQVELHISPDAGAIGALGFASAGQPANYLLEGVGHPGPNVSNSGNELFAFDFNFPASGGVMVPTAPGANLLSVEFNPSANAYGTFGIYARGDPTTSEWSDAAMPVQQRRTFANLPQTGGSVRIADVLVTSVADYNRDGAVDAADYVVWRSTLDQMGTGLAADGNGNNQVDAGDYEVWRANFGKTIAGSAAGVGVSAYRFTGSAWPVPESATIVLAVFGLLAFSLWPSRPV
jgi:hypothetical protein